MPFCKNQVAAGRAFAVSLLCAVCLVAAASAQASSLPTLSITVTKSSVTVAGTVESGAVNVVTTATGLKEGAATLFLMKPGVTPAEVEDALRHGAGKDPNVASKYGTLVCDGEATPGHPAEAQTILQPGQYLVIAGPGNAPPSLKQTFTVTAAAAPVALPKPQATIRAIEFGFRGPSVLHDGELVRFENAGFLVHMDAAFPVKSKKAATKAIAALRSGNEKTLERLIAGTPVPFTGPLSHEAFQQETITAKPGWYVQLCFMETQDGRDHTRLGMERIIKITK
jgi:hypothetical protein